MIYLPFRALLTFSYKPVAAGKCQLDKVHVKLRHTNGGHDIGAVRWAFACLLSGQLLPCLVGVAHLGASKATVPFSHVSAWLFNFPTDNGAAELYSTSQG